MLCQEFSVLLFTEAVSGNARGDPKLIFVTLRLLLSTQPSRLKIETAELLSTKLATQEVNEIPLNYCWLNRRHLRE